MYDDGARQRGGLSSGGKKLRDKKNKTKIKKGNKMKINIKTRRTIDVKEVKTIGFHEVKTIAWMSVRGVNVLGDNINVKRI